MFRRDIFLSIMVISVSILFCGCSYFLHFYQPLTPQEQLIVDIYPILDYTEKKAINKLDSPEEVQAYINQFWDDMDATPYNEINEFRLEYEARLQYVQAHYPYKRGWTHSDRARIYLIYGPPDDIYFFPWEHDRADLKAIEIWVYTEFIIDGHFATIFDKIDPHMMRFAFADLYGVGRYTQIYSNVPGEKIDPRVILVHK